jgi:YkoY family integral membrane protein
MVLGMTLADTAAIVGAILWLVLLEGLLSADNALVLAVMVRHLPKAQQKRALRYGIWGAFVFRAIAVLAASMLLRYWWLKVLGGLYLLWLVIKHFAIGESDSAGGRKAAFGSGFWATVINVELADIAFSIDSILAAVATAEGLPAHIEKLNFGPISVKLLVVYVGGVLGIIAMRLVAGVFLILLERFQGLTAGAYILVGWIGLKLVGSGVHAWSGLPSEMPDLLFWVVMFLIVGLSMLYRPGGGEGAVGARRDQDAAASPNGPLPGPGEQPDNPQAAIPNPQSGDPTGTPH